MGKLIESEYLAAMNLEFMPSSLRCSEEEGGGSSVRMGELEKCDLEGKSGGFKGMG